MCFNEGRSNLFMNLFVKALKVVIDDFEFSIEELEPFLGEVFSLLFNLLKVRVELLGLNLFSELILLT